MILESYHKTYYLFGVIVDRLSTQLYDMKWYTIFVVALLMIRLVPQVVAQTTYTINNPSELEDQVYEPGDEVVLADGSYDTDERIVFLGNGTADRPITFRAKSPGGVLFTGGLQINIGGDHVVVDGFHWQGGFGASNFIQFRDGTDYANHSTIQNCAIDGLAIHPDDVADDLTNNSITKHRWIVLYGSNNSVINCSFLNKESAGALVLAEYQYNAEDDPCAVIGHTISNNYFYRYAKVDNTLSNAGDSETIRIGTSTYQNLNSNVTVSNNYFVESDGENEIITNKSKGNRYINNTFRRCRGSLVLRHGSSAVVDNNYFLGEQVDGTGGIRISDSDQTITNNYIQDCITKESQAKWNNGITFLGGNANAAVACTSTNVSNGYQKSDNLLIANNSIINTHSPLFFNTDKGSTDPTGQVTNNLVYYSKDNLNVTDLFTGDTPTSYTDLGTALSYADNVYTGADLGVINNGFTLAIDIEATALGEIFTFSGNSLGNAGADLGNYMPTSDDMVGYGIDLTDLYDLINTGTGSAGDQVRVHSYSKEEVNGVDKFNYASNTLDKDQASLWAADDGPIVTGDYRGDGEYVIYDLSRVHAIALVQFSTTNKSDAFGFQVWVSTTGTEDTDFTMVLPETGDLLLTSTGTTDFNQYEVDLISARYIKLIGYGRFDGDTRTSVWSAVREVEFYGNEIVSVDDPDPAVIPSIYPLPATDVLYLEEIKHYSHICLYDMNGSLVLEKGLGGSEPGHTIDISSISSGTYVVTLRGVGQHLYAQEIVVIK